MAIFKKIFFPLKDLLMNQGKVIFSLILEPEERGKSIIFMN